MFVGHTIFYKKFSDVFHIQLKCEKYPNIFCGVLSIPHNTVMDVNNIMYYFSDLLNF